MKVALILSVLAFGGPSHAKPSEVDARLEVANAKGTLVATSQAGNLTVRLRPGAYTVTASGGPQVCERRSVTIKRRPVKLALGCSIP